jgi:hypothetical protein
MEMVDKTRRAATMIKGARQRTENRGAYGGFNTVDLLQCDLKRSIQISDTAKICCYIVGTGDQSLQLPLRRQLPVHHDAVVL